MMNYQYLMGLLAFILFTNSGITMERTTRESSPEENKHLSSASPTEALSTSLKAENDFSELEPYHLKQSMIKLIISGLRVIPVGHTILLCKGSFKYMLIFKQATDIMEVLEPLIFDKQELLEIVLKQKKRDFTIGKYARSYEIVYRGRELSVLSAFDLGLVGKAFRIPINKE